MFPIHQCYLTCRGGFSFESADMHYTRPAAQLARVFIVLDALISITSLAVGIVGILGVAAMPAVAAYTLLGISGLITLLWLGGQIRSAAFIFIRIQQPN